MATAGFHSEREIEKPQIEKGIGAITLSSVGEVIHVVWNGAFP